MSSKGKEVASSSGRRKRRGVGEDKSGGGSKRRNREVLQFFEDAAEVDESESESENESGASDFDSMEEDFDIEVKVKKEPVKVPNLPFIPKEEEIDEEEFDKMMEERYNAAASAFVRYEEDAYDGKRPADRNFDLPSSKDPVLWKVKCMVGRERHSVFCLMQKFVDLKSLGTKLQMVSAFSVDHAKGFIFIEANKEIDIYEACKGLSSIYYSRVAPVPRNEVSHLLTVRTKHGEVGEGMWVRVKNGKYKGDLAQIVAVNDTRKKATVKLIPRIDLQAMAQKFGGGISLKNAATPAPRLITSSELEEFRPLVQIKRDRDTGKTFEVLDGQMLKDGFLYKKVSVDSLSCWGVMPSEEELLKFKPSDNNESENLEWLTQLYGGQKKRRVIKNDKGGEKGESSSGSGLTGFELYELVCFGRKDFGLVVGMEKDDSYKILKEGVEGPIVVPVGLRDLKNGPSDMKFTALDHWKKTISINDAVMVLEGSSKDRQGIVKQIYRGIVFIYNEDETENGGYFCSKAQLCEKINSGDTCGEKGGGSGFGGFDDFPSSPKSPLSPKRPWQAKETSRDFNQGEKEGMFSIGQTLRIRVGPLKGYLCRVLAVRRYDVTVKLDSQQKVLTVKCENLAELRVKTSAVPFEEPGSSSFKPFDVLGTEGISGGWTDGAGTSTAGNGWNVAGLSADRTSWPSFPASGSESAVDPGNSSISVDADLGKEDGAWEKKVTTNQNSSWGAAAAANKAVADDLVGGWGKKEDCWNKAVANISYGGGSSDGWGKAALRSEDPASSTRDLGENWSRAKPTSGSSSVDAAGGSWDKGKNVTGNSTSGWGKANTERLDSQGKHKGVDEAASWEKNKSSSGDESCWTNKDSGWNQLKSQNEGSWGKAAEAQNKGTVQEDSCGKAAEKSQGKGKGVDEAASWEKNKSSSRDESSWTNKDSGWNHLKSQNEGGWGKAAEAQKKDTVQEDSWGKATEKSGGRESLIGSKAEWQSLTPVAGKHTDGWGNASGSWLQPEAQSPDNSSAWMKSKVESASQTANDHDEKNTTEDATGWVKGGSNKSNENDNWNKSKAFAADVGSWNKQKGGSSWGDGKNTTEDATGWTKGGSSNQKQDDGWNDPKSFGADRGSWNKRQGESPWGKKEGGASWGRQEGGSAWTRKDSGSSWNKQDKDQDFDGEKKAFDGGRGSGGRRGWGGRNEFGRGRSFGKDQSCGWNSGQAEQQDRERVFVANESSKGQNLGGSWNGSYAADGSLSSGWNKESAVMEEPSGGSGVGSKWDTQKSSSDNGVGWKGGVSGVGAKQSDWGAQKASKQDDPSGWGSKAIDPDDGQRTGWGSQSNDTSGNHDSAWGKKGNWNSGSGDANQDSGWVKKSSWSSTDADQDSYGVSHSEDQTKSFSNRGGSGSWRGGFGGRGNSERGGFRGRGDRGGFGGRSGSDRGRGRGRSDRGGFSGRGRFGGRGGSDGGGYDGSRGGYGGRGSGWGGHSSSWKGTNDSGEERACDWKNGGGSGWKSDDAGGGSSQGDGNKGQWKSWESASAGTSSWGNNGDVGSSKGGWN